MTYTALRGIVGSTAYGLNHDDSDLDRLGVFIAPTKDVAGLNWSSARESHVNQGPGRDDFAEHEIAKFLKLVLKGNPTVMELLWLEDDLYEFISPEGKQMINFREHFLSEPAIRASYGGYAFAQQKKYRDGFPKAKYARHSLRLVDQGLSLLETGHLEVRVANPQRYWDLADMTNEQVNAVLDEAFKRFQDLEKTALPQEPSREHAEYILEYVRQNHFFAKPQDEYSGKASY